MNAPAKRRCAAAAVLALLGGLFVGLLGARPAAADDYAMRIVSPPALSPSSLTIHPVDRVVFTNSTGNTWRVQVGSSYDVVLFPGQSADGSGLDPDPYVGTSAGTYHVVASSASAGGNLSGTITVRSGSTSSPPPATTAPPPKPSAGRTSAPAPTSPAPAVSGTSSSASPSATPSVSASASSTPTPRRSSSPRPSTTPRSGAAPPVASPAPSPSAQALTGPVQDVGTSGVGLPGAVGSVLLAGLIAALVRVLLAEPVEDRPPPR